jgi:hypothetical protein
MAARPVPLNPYSDTQRNRIYDNGSTARKEKRERSQRWSSVVQGQQGSKQFARARKEEDSNTINSCVVGLPFQRPHDSRRYKPQLLATERTSNGKAGWPLLPCLGVYKRERMNLPDWIRSCARGALVFGMLVGYAHDNPTANRSLFTWATSSAA